MPSRPAAWFGLLGHLCRIGIAFVFLSAGVLKSFDPEGFTQEVIQYGLLSGAIARVFAYILIPVEVVTGAALLLNFRPVLSFTAAVALLLMFVGVVGYAI